LNETKTNTENWNRLWKFYNPPYRNQVPVKPGWVAAVYAEGEGFKQIIKDQQLRLFIMERDWKEKAEKYDALDFDNGEKLNKVSQASQCIAIIEQAGIEVKEGTIAHKLMTVLEAVPAEGNKY